MGGSIAIAARFNDGQTICLDGWTNFIPRMLMNQTTLSGDDAVVRKIMLEVASHETYEGPQPFRAQGYGMVVIDFVAREIHSMQGYTSFRRKSPNQLLDINATGWKDGVFVNVLSDEAKPMLDAGRIRKVITDGEPCEAVTLTCASAQAMLDDEHRAFMQGEPRTFHMLEIDTSPFVVHDYPEGGSLTAMKARLAAAGFPTTKAAGLNAMFTGGRNIVATTTTEMVAEGE